MRWCEENLGFEFALYLLSHLSEWIGFNIFWIISLATTGPEWKSYRKTNVSAHPYHKLYNNTDQFHYWPSYITAMLFIIFCHFFIVKFTIYLTCLYFIYLCLCRHICGKCTKLNCYTMYCSDAGTIFSYCVTQLSAEIWAREGFFLLLTNCLLQVVQIVFSCQDVGLTSVLITKGMKSSR